jgi:hypothetical protein
MKDTAMATRLDHIDWDEIERGLRSSGAASLGRLLSPHECKTLSALYEQPKHFRSHIRMEQYRFGRGEYRYFAYPLPTLVDELRHDLYRGLAPVASRWFTDLGIERHSTFPTDLEGFLNLCHDAGQTRPTPLLLKYETGDYNCLHQDLYGDVVFPFQVILGMNCPGRDYEGGELLLVEQQPRAQSVGRVIPLQQGEGVAITTRYRPVRGTRGYYRTNMRHGVSEVRKGHRFTLGIIFHDGK